MSSNDALGNFELPADVPLPSMSPSTASPNSCSSGASTPLPLFAPPSLIISDSQSIGEDQCIKLGAIASQAALTKEMQKLLDQKTRSEVEAATLRAQMQKLESENKFLSDHTSKLQHRITSLELEAMDAKDEGKEAKRNLRRAEHKLTRFAHLKQKASQSLSSPRDSNSSRSRFASISPRFLFKSAIGSLASSPLRPSSTQETLRSTVDTLHPQLDADAIASNFAPSTSTESQTASHHYNPFGPTPAIDDIASNSHKNPSFVKKYLSLRSPSISNLVGKSRPHSGHSFIEDLFDKSREPLSLTVTSHDHSPDSTKGRALFRKPAPVLDESLTSDANRRVPEDNVSCGVLTVPDGQSTLKASGAKMSSQCFSRDMRDSLEGDGSKQNSVILTSDADRPPVLDPREFGIMREKRGPRANTPRMVSDEIVKPTGESPLALEGLRLPNTHLTRSSSTPIGPQTSVNRRKKGLSVDFLTRRPGYSGISPVATSNRRRSLQIPHTVDFNGSKSNLRGPGNHSSSLNVASPRISSCAEENRHLLVLRSVDRSRRISSNPTNLIPIPTQSCSHPHFSFEPAASYLVPKETEIRQRKRQSPLRTSPLQKRHVASAPIVIPSASASAIQDAASRMSVTLRERLKAITVDGQALLELLVAYTSKDVAGSRVTERNVDSEALVQGLRRLLGDINFTIFEKYVHRFDAGIIPLGGPSGLLVRVRKLIEQTIGCSLSESALAMRLFSPSQREAVLLETGRTLFSRFCKLVEEC